MRVAGNQGYVSRKRIHRKIFEQIGIGQAYLHVFLMTMREIDSYSCRGVFRALLPFYPLEPFFFFLSTNIEKDSICLEDDLQMLLISPAKPGKDLGKHCF